jgi:hypothetical protein
VTHPGIVEATDQYEGWMRTRVPLSRSDLAQKHAEMAATPLGFLRATHYRWVPRWLRLCPDEAAAPRVLGVGDVHVESFGTWRDAEGRLVWGVNDLDEAAVMPHTADLVRLATSARLAIKSGHLELTTGMAAGAILDGYQGAVRSGGRPMVLAEQDRWLRRLVTGKAREPGDFWARLQSRPTLDAPLRPVLRQALLRSLPRGMTEFRLRRRRGDPGSLGRERVVAEGEWAGARLAREVTARVPSAWSLAEGAGPSGGASAPRQVLAGAVRSRDPHYAIGPGYISRRLAPDCSRLDLDDLPRGRDDVRLLSAMGWEVGNLHLATPDAAAAILPDLESRPEGWLEEAARRMARATMRDWRDWRVAHRKHPGRGAGAASPQ